MSRTRSNADELRKQEAELRSQLEAIEAKRKKIDDERYRLVGWAVEQYASTDPEFRAQLRAALSEVITANSQRELVDLPKLETKRGRPRKNAQGGQASAGSGGEPPPSS